MPAVRKVQATRVHGRTQRAQAASSRPSIRAAAAKEKRPSHLRSFHRVSRARWHHSPVLALKRYRGSSRHAPRRHGRY